MSDISNEIASIAIANGYDGDMPQTVTEAIDALTVALGGEASSETVSEAIKALAPNISGGGDGDTIPIGNYASIHFFNSNYALSEYPISNWQIRNAEYTGPTISVGDMLISGFNQSSTQFVFADGETVIVSEVPDYVLFDPIEDPQEEGALIEDWIEYPDMMNNTEGQVDAWLLQAVGLDHGSPIYYEEDQSGNRTYAMTTYAGVRMDSNLGLVVDVRDIPEPYRETVEYGEDDWEEFTVYPTIVIRVRSLLNTEY